MLENGRVHADLVYRCGGCRKRALAQSAGCIGYFASKLSGCRVVDGGSSFSITA